MGIRLSHSFKKKGRGGEDGGRKEEGGGGQVGGGEGGEGERTIEIWWCLFSVERILRFWRKKEKREEEGRKD